MKTSILLRTLGVFALAGSLLAGCDTDNNDDDVYSISGSATGAQENPPVTTNGTATLTGNYNRDNNMLSYTINWTGMTGALTAAHFHGPASVGQNAPPIHDITISTNGTSGTASGTITLADSTESHLLNGRLYYNLHTALYPNGEVRAQVAATN